MCLKITAFPVTSGRKSARKRWGVSESFDDWGSIDPNMSFTGKKQPPQPKPLGRNNSISLTSAAVNKPAASGPKPLGQVNAVDKKSSGLNDDDDDFLEYVANYNSLFYE